MAISGTDDMGAYVDTGCNSLPTTRASADVDIHSVTPTTDQDLARGDKTIKLPAPRRSSGQRR